MSLLIYLYVQINILNWNTLFRPLLITLKHHILVTRYLKGNLFALHNTQDIYSDQITNNRLY